MAIHTIHGPVIGPEFYDTSDPILALDGSGLSWARLTMRDLRNAMRAKLPLNDATAYTVSDIAINTVSSITSIFFIVRDNANGCEWWFMTGESSTASAPDVDDWYGTSGAILRQNMVQVGVGSGTGTTSPQAGFLIAYNDDVSGSAATTVAFDDLTALTFTGGDFSASSLDLDTAGAPAAIRNGSIYGADFSTSSSALRPSTFTFDDDSARPALLSMLGQDRNVIRGSLLGRILNPATGGDTNEQGLWHFLSSGGGVSTTSTRGFAFDLVSAIQEYSIQFPEILKEDAIVDDGGTDKLNFRHINFVSGSGGAGTKGSIKRELAVMSGPTESFYDEITRHFGFLSNGQAMFKYLRGIGLMQENDEVPYPFTLPPTYQFIP